MGRTVVFFCTGLLFGFIGLQLACRGFLLFAEGAEADAANRRGLSLADYQQWVDVRYERPFLLLSAAGGLLCATLAAAASQRLDQMPARRAPDRRPRGSDDPLTREEFRQVAQACLLVPLAERSPEYVRGLVVGRLADTAPALARKVDGFSDNHMAAVYADLCARQDRLSRGA